MVCSYRIAVSFNPPTQNTYNKYYLKHCHKCAQKIHYEGMLSDEYSTKQSRVLYLSGDTSPSTVFFIHTITDGTISGMYIAF